MRPMRARQGIYEIPMDFFLVVVLIVAVLFFLGADAQSAQLYAFVHQQSNTPAQAVKVKDALLACQRGDYLVESLMDDPCPAKEMLKGYRVTQLPLNGCEEKVWSYARGAYSQSIPFYVVVAQETTGIKCLARLDVLA